MSKKYLTINKKRIKANIYKDGEGLQKMNDHSAAAAKEAFSSENLGSALSGATGAIGTITEAALANAEVDTTEADNAIQAINNFEPATSSLDSLAQSYNNLDFASTNWKGSDFSVSTGEGLANMGKAGLAGAVAGAQMGGVWGAIGGLAVGLGGSGAGWAVGANKAKTQAEILNAKAKMANNAAKSKALMAKDEITDNAYNNFMSNIASYGGSLKHTGDFSNGIIFIDKGGTHEQNPFGGVLMGVDQEGTPNLVEEGEIIWNDYVFSNKLTPTKKLLEDVGFNKKYNDWTFALIAEDLQKKSAEMPNDSIEKRGLEANMMKLMTIQEAVREKKGLKGQNRLMANGGHIFDGETDFSEWTSYDEGWLDGITQETFNDVAAGLEKKNSNWLSYLGVLTPTLDTAGKLIANAVKPVDKSNFIQEEAYSNIPTMKLGRVAGNKVNYKGVDRNAFINPIINQGRATARDIQNLGITGADALNRLALNTYNTQRAIADANFKADQQDLTNRLSVNQFNAGLDATDIQFAAREQASDIERAKLIAQGRIADATALEQAQNAKLAAQDKLSSSMTQGVPDLARQGIEWDMIKQGYGEYIDKMGKSSKYGGMLTKRKRRK